MAGMVESHRAAPEALYAHDDSDYAYSLASPITTFPRRAPIPIPFGPSALSPSSPSAFPSSPSSSLDHYHQHPHDQTQQQFLHHILLCTGATAARLPQYPDEPPHPYDRYDASFALIPQQHNTPLAPIVHSVGFTATQNATLVTYRDASPSPINIPTANKITDSGAARHSTRNITINPPPPTTNCTARYSNNTTTTTASIPSLRRSLTSPLALYCEDAMTSILEDSSTPMPGSPPELSGSKSSKSSSFHSSYQSDNDEILTDITHFEDIGLDDDARSEHVFVSQDPVPKPYSSTYVSDLRTSIKRPSPPAVSKQNIMQRELTSSKMRPAYPSLRGPVRGALGETGLGLMPVTTMSKRGFTSPSMPALGTIRRNRSSSPNHIVILPPATKHRRGSWQSNRERKTLAQLEKECDEEDGDDVPDDCLLENVPISPRPFKERMHSSPPSPDRIEKKEKVRGVGNGTPAIPVAQGSLRSPSSPKPPMGNRGISMGQFPISHDGFGRQPRAKSWTAALSDLSPEAKALTEALEAHADEQTALPKERRSMSAAQPKLRHKSSMAELPPLRRTDIMIDPLPISKEKEAVLSRTRPSWLPPKNPAEEKRHLKEYQRMMALSLEAERKKEAEQKAKVTCRDDTAGSLLRIWEEHVLPNWDTVLKMKRTRELWWRGISPRSRGTVWQKAVGNELGLTGPSFDAALSRAKELEQTLAKGHGNEEDKRMGLAFEAIRRDVAITYPELRIFQLGGPLCESLVDVLIAYTMYRSDIGYVAGTNTIAALLLLNLPTTSATFITLSNLLNRPLPLAFLSMDRESTARIYSHAISTIATKLPTLYNHLCSLANPTINFRESPQVYLKPIFTNLFTSSLDLDSVTRLWDVWVFEGDAVLVRAAVAVFSLAESRLYGATTRDEVLKVLKGLPAEMGAGPGKIDEEKWMKAVKDAGRTEK